MARNAANVNGWRGRQLVIPVWWVVAALIVLPLLVFLVLAGPMNHDENVALSRNEVVEDSSGGRTWHGIMMNTSSSPSPSVFREVAVTIHFLDGDGQPVGETSGRADRLESGEGIDLQALLPPEAESMKVYSLQWRTARLDFGVLLGPWPSWQFGYLQYDPSD
jgi:hypothetical protein